MSLVPPGWTPAGLAARLRSLWRGLRRREAIEAEMGEEFRHHVELRTEDLMRRERLSRKEAYRRARLEFGHVEGHREDARASMGLRGFDQLHFSWLDVKLGLRLLAKYPALSLVSTAGIAIAVAIGTVGFAVVDTLTASDLPLHEGDRLVTIENQGGRLAHLHDLETWRRELESVSALGAYRQMVWNLAVGDGGVSPGRVVEMTSSGFDIARVPPLLGRALVAEDERPGAPDVAVIGHGVWETLFGGSPDALGRTVRIGATTHTIVGVMPEGFAFPVNDRIWTPLRLNAVDFERGAAPPIEVFARLAPGATVDRLEAELAVIRDRLEAEYPDIYERVRPTAYGYGQPLGPWSWALHLVQVLVTLLLVVIAINVAALVYARTATRSGEIAVRSALGASRARIAWQLFAEGLVLSCAGALLGLLLARVQLGRINRDAGLAGAASDRPFWWDFDVTTSTVLYVVGLAVLSAVIIGVVPALGATGRRLREGLQSVGSRAPAPALGRVWTGLIIGQVALAVAVLPVATNALWQWGVSGLSGREQAVDAIVSARLHVDPASPLLFNRRGADRVALGASADPKARYSALQAQLIRRLEDEPGVAHVVGMRPAPWEDPDLPILVAEAPPEEGGVTGEAGASHVGALAQASVSPTMRLAGWSRVEPEFFPAMGMSALSGRLLQEDDAHADAPVVVVSETFVRRVLDGAPAVGRWVRLAKGSQRWAGPVMLSDGSQRWGMDGETWFRIVGVVPDFPKRVSPYPPEPKIYQALPAGVASPLTLGIRLRGTPSGRFQRRLNEIAVGIDPLLRVESFSLGARIREGEAQARMLALVIAALAGSILLLAVAGLYALVSFTVTRRRREIGIRSALGGRPERILGSILAGVAWRLALGITIGLGVAWVADAAVRGEFMAGRGAVILPAVALLVIVVGLLAAWDPLRRALRVQPTEVLQAE